MLSLVEFAEFLTNRLNEIGATQDEKYEFNIYAEVGEAKAGVINGALRTDFPQTTPVADLVNVKYDLRVEFAVPSGLANFNVKNIEEIISLFIEAENGVEKTFSSGKGLITATLSRVKDFKVEPKVGTMLPLEFVIRVNYTEDVITSGSKHWFLNDLEIPFLNESVIVEKNGVTKNISGQNYKETFLTEKLKLYRFRFPFDTKNALCSMLQKDLLESGANKTYTLRYYDGVSFLNEEGKDFKTTVSIYRTNDTSSVKPETAMFDITFTDVKLKSNVKYFMGLIDNPFDGQTEDTMYFESLEEQQEWFNEMVANGCKYEEIPVPNLDSIDVTNQIYNFDTELYNVFDVTKKNYAIIKVVIEKENSEDVEYYFYYNITNPQIGTENQVSFSMQLDSLQTYYFIDEIKFEGSFIQKTLLNRWVPVYSKVSGDRPSLETAISRGYYAREINENGELIKYVKITEENYEYVTTFYRLDNSSIQFNGNIDSKLFEREEIKDIAKRLIQRRKLKYSTDLKYCIQRNKEMVDWINEGVDFWVYYIMDAPTNYSTEQGIVTLIPTMVVENQFYEDDRLNYTVGEICVPFCRTGTDKYGKAKPYSIGFKEGSNKFSWDFDGMFKLFYPNLEGQIGYSKVKSVRVSIKPPFMFNKDVFDYEVVTHKAESITDFEYSNLLLNVKKDGELETNYSLQTDSTIVLNNSVKRISDKNAILLYQYDYKEPIYLEADIDLPEVDFYKGNVIGEYKNKNFNPKLNGEDYKELRLAFMGNTFGLPLNKINQKNIVIKYNEMLTPDITKGIARVVVENEDGVFNKDYEDSFNGFIFTNDFSIPISNGQLEQYLANNKNAYLSFQAQQDYNRETQNLSLMQQGINGAFNASNSTSWRGLINSAGQTSANMMFSEMNFQKSQALRQTQFDLSMDNMRNAPRTLVNANGNAIFGDAVSEFGMYLELYEGLDHELEIANDIMARDGYTYNQFDDIKKYDKVRKFFNYIKANIGTITGIPISNQARADLRNRFANGVRFWNKNEEGKFVVDYSKENYEKWIETAYSSFEEWLENQ